jgi:hypothetical protein
MSSPFQKAFSNKSPLGYVSIQPAIAGAYKAAEGHISNLKDLKGKEKQKEAFKNIGQDDYTQADYDIDYPKASTSTSSESLDARNNAEADYYRSLMKDTEVGEEVNEGVRDLNGGSEVSKTPDNYFSKYLEKYF